MNTIHIFTVMCKFNSHERYVSVNICRFSAGRHTATFPYRSTNRAADEPTSATARQHEGRYVTEQDSFCPKH
jgi:hypothetical protein